MTGGCVRRVIAGMAALGATLVVGASMASAATRYASPTGSDRSACAAASPCDIAFALSMAVDGDTVELAEGVYSGRVDSDPFTYSPGDILYVNKSITLRGATTGVSLTRGARIFGSSWDVIRVTAPNVSLQDLVIYGSNQADNSTHALGITADRVHVTRVVALAVGGDACFLRGDNIVMTFTLCRGGRSGVKIYTHIEEPARTVTLQNVTASASRWFGIEAQTNSGALRVNLINAIARGGTIGAFDVNVASAAPQAGVTVVAGTSNFRTVYVGNGSTATSPAAGTNTVADPVFGHYSTFFDQYFRLGPSSPPSMVNGGTSLTRNGSNFDAFGTRIDTTRPPIGAYAYMTGQSNDPEPAPPNDILDQIGGGSGTIAPPTSTPTPTPTAAAITVTRPRTTVRRASIRVRTRATVSNAGTLTQRITVRRGKRTRTVCRIRMNFLQATTKTLTCTLGKATRKALRSKRQRLTVTTVFVADTVPTTRAENTKRVTVKRRR